MKHPILLFLVFSFMVATTVHGLSVDTPGDTAKCITHFKVHAETGDVHAGSQYPYNGGNPILKILLHNGWYYNIELTGSTPQGSTYTKEFAFYPRACVRREDIKEVQLKAGPNGNGGWYVASINTYTAAGHNHNYDLLTMDPGFSMWVDANKPSSYPYDATKHRLTKAVESDCISYVKVEAMTGDKPYAEFSRQYGANHLIVLELDGDRAVQAEIEGPIYRNAPYSMQLQFASRFRTTECVKVVDISAVRLKTQSGGDDGWYIASISTFVKSGVDQYEQITSDPNFNKWLDANEAFRYPYDATILPLEMRARY